MQEREPKLIPELLVRDIQSSLSFWRGLIGFKVIYERPEERFACINLDGARLLLEERQENVRQWVPTELVPPLGRGINLQIEVRTLEPIIQKLSEAAWPLFMAPEVK
ncbi:VOC family protein [Hongsoonwoonella zoysiae]|uniref:VOC family protein n=1 Tax=Hongsoonwoonella zoysiae TaxID=2821844 RepID=UPI001FE809FA|nr:VOC family protein [Hongsoonwoonella zoysiae]